MELMVKLVHFFFGLCECSLSFRRDPVKPPPSSIYAIERRSQQSRSFQPVQQRIECARADAVTMVRKLIHHRESKDGLVRRMHQHMHPNESVEKFALLTCHVNQYTASEL